MASSGPTSLQHLLTVVGHPALWRSSQGQTPSGKGRKGQWVPTPSSAYELPHSPSLNGSEGQGGHSQTSQKTEESTRQETAHRKAETVLSVISSINFR